MVGDNLWLHSLQVLGARRVILIDIVKPFIALTLARLMLFEAVRPGVVLGMAITLCGVLTVSMENSGGDGDGDTAESVVGGSASRGGGGGESGDGDGEILLEVELGQVSPPESGTPAGIVVDVDLLGEEETRKGTASKVKTETEPVTGVPAYRRRGGDSISPERRRQMTRGYAAAALNVAFDTWGTVLTKQHGAGLNTWEVNFVRFGSAAAALAVGAMVRRYVFPIIAAAVAAMGGGSGAGSGKASGAAFTAGGRGHAAYANLDSGNRAIQGGSGEGVGARGGTVGGILPSLGTRGWIQVLGGIFMTTFLAPGKAVMRTHAEPPGPIWRRLLPLPTPSSPPAAAVSAIEPLRTISKDVCIPSSVARVYLYHSRLTCSDVRAPLI